MTVWRDAGAGQPVYKDKELVAFEVHHGSNIVKNKQNKWCYTGGHMGKVSLKGVVNDELLDIDTDGELLSLCDKIPLSYETVVLIYVQHIEEEGVTVNEDCEEDSEEEDAALNEDIGPVTDENRAFTFQNRPLNNNKEGRHFTEDHGPACRVEDWVSSDDDGPLNNEGNRANICETDVEERNEDNEEEDKEDNLDFVDSAYEQSENECDLLKKDNKAFENYVD
ncbi:unnamed protein product [Prunus armeniaca]|uniref:Uncharacterized protein n=1 Tax=Prunus armeniaca TaxID=36596 RepID=A0A6J5W1M4_PRUAR|nr:unnamed protein product [Prunus armeniaca]